MWRICIGIALCLVGSAKAHSFLTNPTADWTDVNQPECRVGKPDGPEFASLPYMQCHGPCGDTGVHGNGATFFSEQHGKTTLARGQKLYMKWTKNNHESGFVRFTLVPKNKRMDKAVHSKFAFRYACWEAGEIGCEHNAICGTDQKRLRYQTEVEIPHVFPNGEYVLGWSWYGGTQYAQNDNGNGGQQMSEFGDYWSCANVIIDGSYDSNGVWNAGNNYHNDYTPIFAPGMNDKTLTKCFASVNRLGVCWREPCKIQDSNGHDTNNRYSGEWQVPAEFANNQSPRPILSREVVAESGGSIVGSSSPRADMSLASTRPIDNSSELKLEKFELVNIRTKEVIPFEFKDSIDVSSFNHEFSVRLIVSDSSQVKSVQFSIDDTILSEENFAPYYVAGDISGEPFAWENNGFLPFNTKFTLTATATLKDCSQKKFQATFQFNNH